MAASFDDARLEDPDVLGVFDSWLRPLAQSGARLRRAAAMADDALEGLGAEGLPRAVIAFGPEARLVRAVLEPTCPVPFVAWPRLGLPSWVGSLDTVVALGGTGGTVDQLAAAAEATRRGARIVVACPPEGDLARASASRSTTLLPVDEDPLSTAIVAVEALARMGLGPGLDLAAVAQAMDDVAVESSARADIAQNPAKAVALELAETEPLVWGGSILAARASRRVAEALRRASGRTVLSADADVLLPLLARAQRRDVFADPFDESPADCRPALVIVDDGLGDDLSADENRRLRTEAAAHELRVSHLECASGDRVQRYVTLLLKGQFAAAYLRAGLEDI